MSVVSVHLQPGDELHVTYAGQAVAPQSKPDDLITPYQVEEQYQVPVRTVRKDIKSGAIDASKPGKSYLLRRRDVETLYAPKKLAANDGELEASYAAQLFGGSR